MAKPMVNGKISQKPPSLGVDAIDRKILVLLQADASLPLAEIAGRVNLSSNACWRRIRKLEEDKIIVGRVAVLDAAKLGYGLSAFVSVRAAEHTDEWLERFAGAVERIPEVVECYRMTGEIDYLLKVVAPDIDGYDRVYKKLIRTAKLADVSASFSMERLKGGKGVPID